MVSSFRGGERFGTCRFQDGSPTLDDAAHILGRKFPGLARYQAFVPSVNSFDFEAVENGGTGHGTDCRIHSGSVPSGSKDSYIFIFFHLSQFLFCFILPI
jgi:hypothetical protein